MIERLRERLVEAEKRLFVMAEEAEPFLEKMRLKGKEQGVRLALSYLDEEVRMAVDESEEDV